MICLTNRTFRLTFAVGVLVLVSACAAPADPKNMVAARTPGGSDFAAPLRNAMCVRNVTGGEETNALWVSKVNNQDFHTALAASLDTAGLTGAATACKYPVDVNLLGLSQPAGGFDMEVTSHVNYKVYDAASQPILLETLSAAYTAKFSDAFAGVERLKLANEGSIRASISQFLDKLRAVKVQ
jgi:hypothetical protein